MQKHSLYIYLNALADTQIRDLLPAIGRLYHNAYVFMI